MAQNEAYKKLFEALVTKKDLVAFLEEQDELGTKVSGKDTLDIEKLSKKYSPQTINILIQARKEGLLNGNSLAQQEFFFNAKNYLQALPMLKLTLAFEPENEFLKRIQSFVEERLGKTIFDLEINPEIIGGVLIEYQGIYRDYSISQNLEKLFENKSLINSLIYKSRA